MDNIKWSPDLSVGIGDIDVQHREFISILRKLAENINKNQKNEINNIIAFLERYADVHFNLEKIYMTVYVYPDTEKHLTAHKEFKEEILKLKKMAEEDKLYIDDINKKLKNYFFNHIKTIDMQMASFLIKKIKK
jgi:hemerythrin